MVTAADVRAVVDTGLDGSIIDSLIASAERLVTARLTGVTLTSDARFEITRYVAGHLVWVRDPEARVSSFSLDNIREGYQQPSKMDLKNSPLWQMAIAFDPSGTLAAVATLGPTAEFRVLG